MMRLREQFRALLNRSMRNADGEPKDINAMQAQHVELIEATKRNEALRRKRYENLRISVAHRLEEMTFEEWEMLMPVMENAHSRDPEYFDLWVEDLRALAAYVAGNSNARRT